MSPTPAFNDVDGIQMVPTPSKFGPGLPFARGSMGYALGRLTVCKLKGCYQSREPGNFLTWSQRAFALYGCFRSHRYYMLQTIPATPQRISTRWASRIHGRLRSNRVGGSIFITKHLGCNSLGFAVPLRACGLVGYSLEGTIPGIHQCTGQTQLVVNHDRVRGTFHHRADKIRFIVHPLKSYLSVEMRTAWQLAFSDLRGLKVHRGRAIRRHHSHNLIQFTLAAKQLACDLVPNILLISRFHDDYWGQDFVTRVFRSGAINSDAPWWQKSRHYRGYWSSRFGASGLVCGSASDIRADLHFEGIRCNGNRILRNPDSGNAG